MRKLTLSFLALLFCITCTFYLSSCNNSNRTPNSEISDESENETSETNYDPELAQKLGADEYGMKTYVFALLKAGPTRDQDSVTRTQIQRAHLDNITRMADEGKLVAAGPFMEEGDFQGIYVFNVETVDEALELTETDPAVQAGRLVFEFYPWYSSATLQLINEWHKKVAKVSI